MLVFRLRTKYKTAIHGNKIIRKQNRKVLFVETELTESRIDHKSKQTAALRYPQSHPGRTFLQRLPAASVVPLFRSGTTVSASQSSGNVRGSRHFRSAPVYRLLLFFHSDLIPPIRIFWAPSRRLLSSHLFHFRTCLTAAAETASYSLERFSVFGTISDAAGIASPPLPISFQQAQASFIFPSARSGTSEPSIFLFSQPSSAHAPMMYPSQTRTTTTATNALSPCTERTPSTSSPALALFYPSPPLSSRLCFLLSPVISFSLHCFYQLRI